MKKVYAFLMASILTVSLAGCSTGSKAVSGTFSGTAKGMGDVTVTITLKDDVITDVQAVGENETDGIGSAAIEKLPSEMVAGNTINVDAVTGATITSDAIISAASAALEAAGKDP